MVIVLQRVSQASVTVASREVSRIGRGLLLLVGLEEGDGAEEARRMAEKIVHFRIFPDREGKMNLSLLDLRLPILSVSQFTLAYRLQRGRRPDFTAAMAADRALPLYKAFLQELSRFELPVFDGEFGALMEVSLVNDGPVTFVFDGNREKRP